jgi:predicted RNA methylase
MLFREIVKIIKKHSSHCMYTVLSVVKEYYFEKKFGIKYISGLQEKKEDTTSQFRDSAGYEGTSYDHLIQVLDYLKPTENDVFIDIGCGKGKVVCFVALQKLKKVLGIELIKEYADIAQKRIEELRPKLKSPAEVYCADAVSFDTKEVTIYYFFNPFGLQTLKNVMENIRRSLVANPRSIRIVYAHPLHEWFYNSIDWLSKEKEMQSTIIMGKFPVTTMVWHNKPDYDYAAAGRNRKEAMEQNMLQA